MLRRGKEKKKGKTNGGKLSMACVSSAGAYVYHYSLRVQPYLIQCFRRGRVIGCVVSDTSL